MMRAVSGSVVMAAALGLAMPALAQDVRERAWQDLGTWSGNVITYDPRGVETDGSAKLVWTRVVPDNPIGGASLVVSRFRVDCAARTSELLSFIGWDEGGQEVLNIKVTAADRQVEAIAANSPNDALAKRLCS